MAKLGEITTPSELTDQVFPAGIIIPYAPDTVNPPTGWLYCKGQTLNGTNVTYTALWDAIGTNFGGTGQSSFNLPDLRDRHPLVKASSGTGSTINSSGGSLTHSHTAGSIAVGAHSHDRGTYYIPDHSHNTSMNNYQHSHWSTSSSNKIYNASDLYYLYSQYRVTTGADNGVSLTVGGRGAAFDASGSLSSTIYSPGPIASTSIPISNSSGTADAPYQKINWIIKL